MSKKPSQFMPFLDMFICILKVSNDSAVFSEDAGNEIILHFDLGYNKPLQLFVEKRQFSIKTCIEVIKSYGQSLINNIIKQPIYCFGWHNWFSVRFCDKSFSVLKMRFRVFSFASKMVQGLSSYRKILMSLLSVLFHLQNLVSVFSFIFQAKEIKRNLRHDFVDERQLKTIMLK